MFDFILKHPVVILYLAAGWFVAALISAMPPLPNGSGFFVTWAYNIAQIVGASLDKVGTAAKQSTAFQQVKNTLETTDADGLKKLATAETTTQIPVSEVKP
jgi:hypothetical protein